MRRVPGFRHNGCDAVGSNRRLGRWGGCDLGVVWAGPERFEPGVFFLQPLIDRRVPLNEWKEPGGELLGPAGVITQIGSGPSAGSVSADPAERAMDYRTRVIEAVILRTRSGSAIESISAILPSTTVKPITVMGCPRRVTITPAAPFTSAGCT